MDPSIIGLRVLRTVAEVGSFTAAAGVLGYSQSAVSRQAAALERFADIDLFERHPDGVRLTAAGVILLRHAIVVLDEIDSAERRLHDRATTGGRVRLGMYISAGISLVPRALVALRRSHPQITVTTREGTTPALVRALRAGTIDLAILASRVPYRQPDNEDPPLEIETLKESALLVAVSTTSALAVHDSVVVADLRDQDWIASPHVAGAVLLGVWPGLGGRPRIAHVVGDWMTKMSFVASGLGVTTVPSSIIDTVPDGVKLLAVRDGPTEDRRTVLGRLPGGPDPAVEEVARALHSASTREHV